jgi:hypothetical protein
VAHQHKTGTHPNCAQLGECGPQSDKPGSLAIEDVSVENREYNVTPDYIEMDVLYRLTRLAGKCRVTLYGVNWGGRERDHGTNPFENLGTKDLPRGAGLHEARDLRWEANPTAYFRLWVVVETKENASVARLYNRDRKPKWAVPRGVAFSDLPLAVNWHDPEWALWCCDVAKEHQRTPYQGHPPYAAALIESRASIPGALASFGDAAIVAFHGHGLPAGQQLAPAGNPVVPGYVSATRPADFDPARDIAMAEHQGEFPNLLFVLYVGCDTGQVDPGRGDLLQATVDAGADAAAGFLEHWNSDSEYIWHQWFWYFLCHEGQTIADAHANAFLALKLWKPSNYDPRVENLRILHGDERVVPARWGG